MNSSDIFLLGCGILCVSIVVSVIRTEIEERRYHRRFMEGLRRSQYQHERSATK